MELRNKLFWFGVIPCFFFAVYLLLSNICFAGEKEELKWQEAYYQKSIECAQYVIVLSQNELKIVQSRLQAIERTAQEEAKKPKVETLEEFTKEHNEVVKEKKEEAKK